MKFLVLTHTQVTTTTLSPKPPSQDEQYSLAIKHQNAESIKITCPGACVKQVDCSLYQQKPLIKGMSWFYALRLHCIHFLCSWGIEYLGVMENAANVNLESPG